MQTVSFKQKKQSEHNSDAAVSRKKEDTVDSEEDKIPAETGVPLFMQRYPASASPPPIQHNSDGDEGKADISIQAKRFESNQSSRTVYKALQGTSGGAPIPEAARLRIEPVLGNDLGHVKVHTDNKANEAARSINAKAFTSQNNIFFGRGQSLNNLRLLAHEATHTVQQSKNLSGNHRFLQRELTDPRHIRGYAGEQSIAFSHYRAQDGWIIVRGAGGSAGHAVTTGGEDILAYNHRTGELHITDNKSLARRGRVGSATAIDPERTLPRNLNNMISHVRAQSPEQMPYRQHILRLLRQTRAAVRSDRLDRIPGRVSLVVANAGGRSTGVSGPLRQRGVTFRDSGDRPTPRPGTSLPRLRGGPPAQSALSTGPASSSPQAMGLRQRIRVRLNNFRGRFRLPSSGRLRSVGGRGIGVLIALAAGFFAGWIESRRQQGLMEQYVNYIENQVQRRLPQLEPVAIALRAKNPGSQIYVNIRYTEEEETYSMYDSVGIDFRGMTLDSVGVSTQNINRQVAYRSEGSLMRSGITDYRTRVRSAPLQVSDLPDPADLCQYLEDLQDLNTENMPGIENQFLNMEISILQELSAVYEELSGVNEDSEEQLRQIGSRLISLHTSLSQWQELDEQIRFVIQDAESRLAELENRVSEENTLSMEDLFIQQEHQALSQMITMMETVDSQCHTEESLFTLGESILEQGEQAHAASIRRNYLVQDRLYTEGRIHDIDYELNNSRTTTEDESLLREERELLVLIYDIENSLIQESFPQEQTETLLTQRDLLFQELEILTNRVF